MDNDILMVRDLRNNSSSIYKMINVENLEWDKIGVSFNYNGSENSFHNEGYEIKIIPYCDFFVNFNKEMGNS